MVDPDNDLALSSWQWRDRCDTDIVWLGQKSITLIRVIVLFDAE